MCPIRSPDPRKEFSPNWNRDKEPLRESSCIIAGWHVTWHAFSPRMLLWSRLAAPVPASWTARGCTRVSCPLKRHPGSTFCHFCLRPGCHLHPENHESDFVDFFSGSGSSGHSIYEIGRKMPRDGFSLWSGSLASDWCLRYLHPLAVGRATRSTYTPSVPMSLQVLVADFAVAKKSLKGNFHFPFGGQPTWTNSCWNSVFGGFFSLLWKKNVVNVNLRMFFFFGRQDHIQRRKLRWWQSTSLLRRSTTTKWPQGLQERSVTTSRRQILASFNDGYMIRCFTIGSCHIYELQQSSRPIVILPL